MITIFLTIVLLTTLGAGCSGNHMTSDTYTYTMTIESSAMNKDTRKATLAQEETTMSHLLRETGVHTEAQQQGDTKVITKLNGVIATLSKKWNLYINNVITPIPTLETIPIRSSDIIEWKYE